MKDAIMTWDKYGRDRRRAYHPDLARLTYRQYLEHLYGLAIGEVPSRPENSDGLVERHAQVDAGRWIWECPGCQAVFPCDGQDDMAICAECGQDGWIRVVFPAEREEIEQELLRQPGFRMRAPVRYWRPDWSLAGLRARTAMAQKLVAKGIFSRALSIGQTRAWATGEILTAGNMRTHINGPIEDLSGDHGAVQFRDSIEVNSGTGGRHLALPHSTDAQRQDKANGSILWNATQSEVQVKRETGVAGYQGLAFSRPRMVLKASTGSQNIPSPSGKLGDLSSVLNNARSLERQADGDYLTCKGNNVYRIDKDDVDSIASGYSEDLTGSLSNNVIKVFRSSTTTYGIVQETHPDNSNWYISRLYTLDLAAGTGSRLPGSPSSFNAGYDLRFNSSGHLLWFDTIGTNARLKRLRSLTGTIETVGTVYSAMNYGSSSCFDIASNGDIIASDSSTDDMFRINQGNPGDTTGNYGKIRDLPSGLTAPSGLKLINDDNDAIILHYGNPSSLWQVPATSTPTLSATVINFWNTIDIDRELGTQPAASPYEGIKVERAGVYVADAWLNFATLPEGTRLNIVKNGTDIVASVTDRQRITTRPLTLAVNDIIRVTAQQISDNPITVNAARSYLSLCGI